MQLTALTLSVKADCFDETALPRVNRGLVSDDRPLVERAVAGQREAFRQLIEMHQAGIARLANRLTGYRRDVDDIVQDVFVIALENITRFRSESSFSTWLTKLTISRCRRERLRRLLKLKFLRAGAQSNHEDSSASSGAEKQESQVRVRETIARLPQKLREVIVLRYLEEMNADEVCQALALSRSALDVRLHRARERLRELLKDLDHGSTAG